MINGTPEYWKEREQNDRIMENLCSDNPSARELGKQQANDQITHLRITYGDDYYANEMITQLQRNS